MEPSFSSPPHRPAASFLTQADALLRKNLTFQKRNPKTNICIASFPILLCLLLFFLQLIIDRALDQPETRCGCSCLDSTLDQAELCSIPNPPRWPSLLQVPLPENRAAQIPDSTLSGALPDESCRSDGSCPVTVLITGQNRTLSQSLAGRFFREAVSLRFLDYLDALSTVVAGTDADTGYSQFVEPAFEDDRPLYIVQPQCRADLVDTVTVEFENVTWRKDVKCVQGLSLWLDNPSEVNNELYKGYQQANADRKSNEFVAAFDFSNTNESAFNVNIWYNSTYGSDSDALVRVPRSVNMLGFMLNLLEHQRDSFHKRAPFACSCVTALARHHFHRFLIEPRFNDASTMRLRLNLRV